MPIATRTFRVFISSTFEDLKEERNALQRDVFPKLRTLCEQHGARFQAIDLRWGVRDEAALDQQTMEICLREIRRCKATRVRPNFIALIGERYGWLPLPVAIPAAEFDALKRHIPAGNAAAQADLWYRLDENAVPPECCLQPRTGEFVEQSAWHPVEKSLLQALASAARAAGLSEKELIKYETSATHQEILAGLGDSEEARQHVFGFVRRPTTNTDPRLDALKSHLRVHEFDAGDMKALCALVLAQLSEVIEHEVKRFEDRPALELEIEAHDRFGEERCRIFIGRESVLDTIADYISGLERRPLVLHGESGSGKSGVMAKASQQYKGTGRMIRRFIGASPESVSGHALLTSLCRQIAPGETPVDYAQLENAFRERLSMATADQPLVLFIDALDQLAASDPARDVTWLPPELPPHAKVIFSTNDHRGRLPEGVPLRLDRMAQQEAGQALDELLEDERRKLQRWQRETVLAHFERCGLPLYLKLAAEESRLWKSYTPENACRLGEGVAGVIDTLFDRLASDANHGPTLVERSLGYLAAARYGLTEDEVLDVLTVDDAVWSDFDKRRHHEVNERRLPVVVWSRLSLDLESYLTERAAPGGTVMAFYHRQLAERVAARFEVQARYSGLARYFSKRPVPDTRRLVELPFQQRRAYQWTEAEDTLFDTQFLFAKVAANLVLDLDTDYEALLQEAPESSLPRGEALRLVHGALRLSMHVLAHDSAQFASQTVGRLLAHRDKPDMAKFVDKITTAAPRPWIRPVHPCLDAPGGPLLYTLEGHTDSVEGVAITADGKRAISASSDRTLMVWDLEIGRKLHTLEGHSSFVFGVAVTADGGRAVSASADHTLKVWELKTGRALHTLRGHSDRVCGVAITADGTQAISASHDTTLKVWDLKTGHTLKTLAGHSNFVLGVAVAIDGKWAVSASSDKTLKVWDLETGHTLHTLEGHSDGVGGVAITGDGKRVVSASYDRTLKVWDLDTGRMLHTLQGHSDSVDGVAVAADGKRAVSASSDKTLKVWNLETGHALHTLEGHSHRVTSVALSSDGSRAASVSSDKTLKVWSLETGGAVRTLHGHSGSVRSVAATANRAVSASEDKTLKVWNLETGNAMQTLQGHSGSVRGVAAIMGGNRAVSASEDKTLKVWDVETGRALRTVEGFATEVFAGGNGVAVTADGNRAVSASDANTLKMWDLETGRTLERLEGHSYGVLGVAVTADGKRAVSASWDRTLRVWDLETGHTLQTLEGHSYAVLGVAVAADGKWAVSASWDKSLKVWDLGTGCMLRTLEGHSDGVLGVAVTADGNRVVSASYDRTVRVWDPTFAAPIAVFFCEGDARCCAWAAPNVIVAGDEGGRVYFLALEE